MQSVRSFVDFDVLITSPKMKRFSILSAQVEGDGELSLVGLAEHFTKSPRPKLVLTRHPQRLAQNATFGDWPVPFATTRLQRSAE